MTSSESPAPRSTGLSASLVTSLLATRGWTSFFCALSWVFSALLLVIAATLAFRSIGGGPPLDRGFSFSLLALALLSAIPGILLLRYIQSLSRLSSGASERDVAEALHAEARLWKFLSMLFLITLGFLAVILSPVILF